MERAAGRDGCAVVRSKRRARVRSERRWEVVRGANRQLDVPRAAHAVLAAEQSWWIGGESWSERREETVSKREQMYEAERRAMQRGQREKYGRSASSGAEHQLWEPYRRGGHRDAGGVAARTSGCRWRVRSCERSRMAHHESKAGRRCGGAREASGLPERAQALSARWSVERGARWRRLQRLDGE